MNCPYKCKNKNKAFFDLPGYKILKCKRCSLLYNSNRPTSNKDYKKNIFDKNYYFKTHKPGFLYEEKLGNQNPSNNIYKKIFNYISSKNKLDLLDVGCANGSFFKIYKNKF